MGICAQDTTLDADENCDTPIAAENMATIFQPYAKTRKPYNDDPPAGRPTNVVYPAPKEPNLTDK